MEFVLRAIRRFESESGRTPVRPKRFLKGFGPRWGAGISSNMASISGVLAVARRGFCRQTSMPSLTSAATTLLNKLLQESEPGVKIALDAEGEILTSQRDASFWQPLLAALHFYAPRKAQLVKLKPCHFYLILFIFNDFILHFFRFFQLTGKRFCANNDLNLVKLLCLQDTKLVFCNYLD